MGGSPVRCYVSSRVSSAARPERRIRCRSVPAAEAQPGDEEAVHNARIVRVSVRPDDVEITFDSGTRWRLLPFQELLVYR